MDNSDKPMILSTMRSPAILVIRFVGGTIYEYHIGENHWMDEYKRKYGRNIGRLVAELNKDKIPYVRVK
jgi:hypothetical protein